MELSFLLARRTREQREVLFLVYPEDTRKVREALSWGPHPLQEGTIHGDRLGAKRLEWLLRRAPVLAVTTKPIRSPILAETICKAHLSGMKITDCDSALMKYDSSVLAGPEEFISLVAKNNGRREERQRLYRGVKNAVEPVGAALLLLALAPILFLVALAVKLTSRGPALYSQERTGLHGVPFWLYKFRSMRLDAERSGPRWASCETEDALLTPIGKFLRASHLDELPQLWNILRGQMSFIGPRPERPCFIRELTSEIPLFRLRTLVKPGVTGWAQVRMGYANTIADSRRKLELDLYYLLHHSPWLNLRIILATFAVLASGGTEAKKREKAALANEHHAVTAPKLRES